MGVVGLGWSEVFGVLGGRGERGWMDGRGGSWGDRYEGFGG